MVEPAVPVAEAKAPDHRTGEALIDDGIGDHTNIFRGDDPKLADDERFLSFCHLPVLHDEIDCRLCVVVIMRRENIQVRVFEGFF